MRVVLDTNVLVSAVLTPGGTAHQIVQLVLRGDLQLCVDHRMMAEYREVLTHGKFDFSASLVGEFLGAILEEAQEILPVPLPGHLPDEADRPFVEVAAAAGVQVLITGNARHFHAAETRGILVKSPGEFLAWWVRQ